MRLLHGGQSIPAIVSAHIRHYLPRCQLGSLTRGTGMGPGLIQEVDHMTIAVLNATTSTPFTRFHSVKTLVSDFLAQRRRYNTVRRELAVLSNRELDDIGIHRFDIPAIAREHAKRA